MFFLCLSWFVDRFCVPLQQKSSSKKNKRMATSVLNKIEYLVLLVAEFASRCKVTEAQAYRYLKHYGAFALCDKHYGIMHTLSLEENLQTLQAYCQRKGGPGSGHCASIWQSTMSTLPSALLYSQ